MFAPDIFLPLFQNAPTCYKRPCVPYRDGNNVDNGFDYVSFKNDLRFNSRFWEEPETEIAPDAPRCAWPDCNGFGEFKAPKSRDDLRSYHLFCLEHVREYNRRWNYYEGMTSADIERDMRKDYTWDRPSWNFGTFRKGPGGGGGFKDDFGFFNEDGTFKREPEDDCAQFNLEERQAFALMDLKSDATLQELKSRYKVLVKKYHPDANGGDKEAEERFKIISQAYTLLKNVILD